MFTLILPLAFAWKLKIKMTGKCVEYGEIFYFITKYVPPLNNIYFRTRKSRVPLLTRISLTCY